MIRILVIEDDKAIRLSLEEDLTLEGYEVDFAVNGVQGLEKALRQNYDLILLDLMLPGLGGLEICKEIRKSDPRTAIIMVTAKSQDIDKVIGLELGADDYLTKPFNSHELRSRIKAVLRRTRPAQGKSPELISQGPFEMNLARHEFRLRGEPVELTYLEFELLALLLKNPGSVLKRDDILNEVWGDDVFVTPRTVDAHIAKMKKKFNRAEDQERIICLRGIGYKFQDAQ